MGNLAFLLIHLQSEPAGDETGHAFHYSFGRSFAADENYKIICVTNEVQPTLFELFIKLIQHYI